MTDLIVGAVLIVLVGAAIAYIVREKKRGTVCIGCPAAGTCSRKNHPDGEGCSCSIDVEAVATQLRQAVSESHMEE